MTSAKNGQRTDQPSGESDSRQNTRTSLLREPELVPVEQIRPTNRASLDDGRRIRYSPICLVEHDDGFLYIVDGNHRFHKKVLFEKEILKLPAWILREGDQDRLDGDPLPSILVQWKTGRITLRDLARMAHLESEAINFKRSPSDFGSITAPKKRANPIHPSEIRKGSEWPTHQKLDLVLQLIKKEISVEMASSKYSLPMDTIEDWLHRSLQAIRDALQD